MLREAGPAWVPLAVEAGAAHTVQSQPGSGKRTGSPGQSKPWRKLESSPIGNCPTVAQPPSPPDTVKIALPGYGLEVRSISHLALQVGHIEKIGLAFLSLLPLSFSFLFLSFLLWVLFCFPRTHNVDQASL